MSILFSPFVVVLLIFGSIEIKAYPEEFNLETWDPPDEDYTRRADVQIFNSSVFGSGAGPGYHQDENFLSPRDDHHHQHEELISHRALRDPKPRNVSLLWVTDSMMEVAWNEPENREGTIEGYRIYYSDGKRTQSRNIRSRDKLKYALQDLNAFTEYHIWVHALTSGIEDDEGPKSNVLVVRTDVKGPGAPTNLNISCLAEDALYVHWQRPTEYYNSIDFYYIDYRSEEWLEFEETYVTSQYQEVFLPNLTSNVMYEIRVRGGTQSVIKPGTVHKGEFSDIKHIFLEKSCAGHRSVNSARSANDFGSTVVVLAICATFTLLLLVVALVIWRRCLQGEYYYLDDPPRSAAQFKGGWLGDGDDMNPAIPVLHFPAHVHQLHVDGDIGFSKEYEAIQAGQVQQDFSAEHSQFPENRQKNRYLNIVAYDHSRVRLQPQPGQKKRCDYVNANYIDGFQKANAYIGTQGPLPSTFETFWRMVWEHQVHIIVMITNLVERGRKKCDMYWPDDGVQTYGLLQVRLLSEKAMATYTLRTLSLRHTKVKKRRQTTTERIIHHYHYTNWPDHGTPSHPLPVLSFIKKSSSANPANAGPIIVHCSAGVGRTGTYIVLDAMLKQIRARGDINVFSFLNHIRAQRNFLVQTEEQYIFIHDALVEAIFSGETSIAIARVPQYLQSLESGTFQDDAGQIISLLQRQYNLVMEFVPKKYHTSGAAKPFNIEKNRNPDFVCLDSSRVMLTPKPGVEGSDYINASFIPGFEALQEFVITQHPLASTKSEFWQMLWDHNIQTVVMLSATDDEEYGIFWPIAGETLDLGNGCHAKLLQESDRVGVVLRDFSIQSLNDDYEMTVKLIQSSHWPHHCETPHVDAFDLVRMVQELIEEDNDSPLAVVDQYGGLEASTFCALTTYLKQVQSESQVDVYMYAKLYHEHRPLVWSTIDDFLFLYRCVESLASQSFSVESETVTSSPSALLNHTGHANEMDTINSLTTSLTQQNSECTGNDVVVHGVGGENESDDPSSESEDDEEDDSSSSEAGNSEEEIPDDENVNIEIIIDSKDEVVSVSNDTDV